MSLYKDVNSMAERCTLQVICMLQRGFLQQAAPLSILAHALVFEPVTDNGRTVTELVTRHAVTQSHWWQCEHIWWRELERCKALQCWP